MTWFRLTLALAAVVALSVASFAVRGYIPGNEAEVARLLDDWRAPRATAKWLPLLHPRAPRGL